VATARWRPSKWRCRTTWASKRFEWGQASPGPPAVMAVIDNRVTNVVWGSDGTMAIDDIVLNWRNIPPCGN
jgi:hypothetical protein